MSVTLELLAAKLDAIQTQLDQMLGRDFYTPAEAAVITGYTAEHIRDRCNDGRIQARRIAGVRDAWEIPASELAKIPRKVKRWDSKSRLNKSQTKSPAIPE